MIAAFQVEDKPIGDFDPYTAHSSHCHLSGVDRSGRHVAGALGVDPDQRALDFHGDTCSRRIALAAFIIDAHTRPNPYRGPDEAFLARSRCETLNDPS